MCCLLLSTPVVADRLRISPDDLRLRVAVSEKLSPAVRKELQTLAGSTPLPVEDGVAQTESLLKREFSGQTLTERKRTLVRYYFLVARLEHSFQFSEEFARREKVLKEAREALAEYIDQLNRLISRGVYTSHPTVQLDPYAPFPLNEVVKEESGALRTLRSYPAPDVRLGRENLRYLREQAGAENDYLKTRLQELRQGEKAFLDEVSLVGRELIKMRPEVKKWVTPPGQGTPFTP